MTHFNKLVLLFLLLPFFTNAQSNYKPGYIVTSKGDTLHGLIDYRQWDNNPGTVAFKKEPGQNNPEVFTTKTANSFVVTGQEYFEKYTVPVSQDAVDVSNLGLKLDTSYRVDTVFLQVINKGRFVTLYRYKDEVKERFYLLETGQKQPYELAYHAFYNRDESEAAQYVKRFRTQLQNVAQKNGISSDHLTHEISGSSYSETDLTKIVQNINGNASNQFTTKKLFGTRWFAGIGANYSNLKFTGNSPFSASPASNNVSPKIDAGIDFLLNKDIQKFYLRAELSFTYGQYNFSYSNPIGTPGGTSSVNPKLYSTTFAPQFIYNFYNNEQAKAFIDLGVSINFASYNHYQSITTYDSFPTSKVNGYPDLEKKFMTVPIKTGITINRKLELYICYVPPVSITGISGTAFRSNMTSYQAGVNYLFGGK
jgi:hypothetical protein